MANVFQPTSCIMITFSIRYILVSPAGVVHCSFIQLSAKNRSKTSMCLVFVGEYHSRVESDLFVCTGGVGIKKKRPDGNNNARRESA